MHRDLDPQANRDTRCELGHLSQAGRLVNSSPFSARPDFDVPIQPRRLVKPTMVLYPSAELKNLIE